MTATSPQALRDLRVAIAKTSTLGYRNSSVEAQADAGRAITQARIAWLVRSTARPFRQGHPEWRPCGCQTKPGNASK